MPLEIFILIRHKYTQYLPVWKTRISRRTAGSSLNHCPLTSGISWPLKNMHSAHSPGNVTHRGGSDGIGTWEKMSSCGYAFVKLRRWRECCVPYSFRGLITVHKSCCMALSNSRWRNLKRRGMNFQCPSPRMFVLVFSFSACYKRVIN